MYTHLESREQPIRYVIDGVEESGIGGLKKKHDNQLKTNQRRSHNSDSLLQIR